MPCVLLAVAAVTCAFLSPAVAGDMRAMRIERRIHSAQATRLPNSSYPVAHAGSGGELRSNAVDWPLVIDSDSAAFTQRHPTVALLDAAHAVGVFADDRNGITELYGQVFDSTGALLGGNVRLTTTLGGRSALVPVAASSDGGAFAAWVLSGQGGVWVEELDINLAVVGGPHRVDADDGLVIADRPAICTSADGGGVAVWEDFSASDNIYGRRLDNNGQPSGARFTVNAASLSNVRWAPHVASGDLDTFAVVWEDYRSGFGAVYFRSFTGNGIPVTGEILVSAGAAGSDAYQPVISSNTSIGFLVAWIDTRTGDTDLYGRIVRADGSMPSASYPIARALDTAMFWDPAVAAQDPASFVIAWSSYGDQTAIMGQRLVNGAVFGSAFVLSAPHQPRDRFAPAVVQFGGGANIALWVDRRAGNFDIRGGRTDAQANPDGFDRLVNDDVTGAQQLTGSVSDLAGGTFWVAYEDRRRDGGDVLLQGLTQTAQPFGAPVVVNTDTVGGEQSKPDLHIDNSGSALVVWSDLRSTAGVEEFDIRGRWYDDGLNAPGGDFRVSDDTDGSGQSCPRVAATTSGGFAVCWLDYRSGDGEVMVQAYKQDRTPDGVNMLVSSLSNPPDGTPPAVATLGSGEFVVCWRSVDSVGAATIWFRPYVVGSPPVGLAPQTMPVDETDLVPRHFAVTTTAADGFAIAFTASTDTSSQVFLQYFDRFGGAIGGNIPIATPGTVVAPDGIDCDSDDAGFVGVVWTDLSGPNPRVVRQLFDPFGAPVGGNAVVHALDDAVVHWSPAVTLSGRNLVVVWDDNRTPDAGFDPYGSLYEYSITGILDEFETEAETAVPAGFGITGNYPNPFNPATTISLSLSRSAEVRIEVYDILGRRVAVLGERRFDEGVTQIVWDGTDDGGAALAAGVYFARLDARFAGSADRTLSAAHKMMLLK